MRIRPRTWGASKGPHTPQRSERPGGAGALVYRHGGPDMAPKPPAFGAPRRSRGAPLSPHTARRSAVVLVQITGGRRGGGGGARSRRTSGRPPAASRRGPKGRG